VLFESAFLTSAEPSATRRLFSYTREELTAVSLSFAYFFCVLSSYYILRPVRDALAIHSGVRSFQWLFTGTFIGSLVAFFLFAALVARWKRSHVLPAVYLFFAANLFIFYLLLKADIASVAVARVFFVWLSVFTVFTVSVFWSFMADVFTNQQARRLYGVIAAGGSLGALAGPAVTIAAPRIGIPNLLLISAALLVVSVVLIRRLEHWAIRHSQVEQRAAEQPLGGTIMGGLRLTFSSRYLLAILSFIFLLTVLATFLYFEQARLIEAALPDAATRAQLFAKMDFAVNLSSTVAELFITGFLITRLGVGGVLCGLLVLNVAGFATLAFVPTLSVLVAFQIFRRASDYALIRPAREVLFTIVSREEKYKAKNFVDTIGFRGSDAVSGWLTSGLTALGAGLSQLALIAVPVSAVGAALGWYLGRSQEKLRPAMKTVVPTPKVEPVVRESEV
jgi:AAA family ATP:ADP antiporter